VATVVVVTEAVMAVAATVVEAKAVAEMVEEATGEVTVVAVTVVVVRARSGERKFAPQPD